MIFFSVQFCARSKEKKVTCANFEATRPRPECLCSWFVNGVSPLTFIIKMVMILKIIVMMVVLMLNMVMDYGEVCVEKR